jgi:hypothetical protein
MLSRKAVCLWLLAGAVCVALAAGGAGLAQQSGPGEPAADPSIAGQPDVPMIAEGGGAVAVIGENPPPVKQALDQAQADIHRQAMLYDTLADRYARVRGEKPDPEMEQLLKEDAEMEARVQALVKQWHEQRDEKARAELRGQVEKLTEMHFGLRQHRRELELSRLEAQLERVRASIKKRSEVKDLIIQRRIARLLGEEDDLAF